MSKYIIELDDDIKYLIINGRADNRCYTLVRPVAELEILNSDYINENFGSLQDEAYKRGYEDGKDSTEKGCEGCKYESVKEGEPPCRACSKAYKNRYTPAPHSDRIEVGDEVKWEGVNFIVLRVFTPKGCYEQCDGFDSEGNGYTNILTKDVHKTGRHFDIASILEAMRQ